MRARCERYRLIASAKRKTIFFNEKNLPFVCIDSAKEKWQWREISLWIFQQKWWKIHFFIQFCFRRRKIEESWKLREGWIVHKSVNKKSNFCFLRIQQIKRIFFLFKFSFLFHSVWADLLVQGRGLCVFCEDFIEIILRIFLTILMLYKINLRLFFAGCLD